MAGFDALPVNRKFETLRERDPSAFNASETSIYEVRLTVAMRSKGPSRLTNPCLWRRWSDSLTNLAATQPSIARTGLVR